MIRPLAFTAVLALLSASAQAQDASPATPPPAVDLGADRLTIGVGPAVVPSYTGSDQYGIVPGIAIQGQVDGLAFASQGTALWLDAIRGSGGVGWKAQAGPIAALRLDRTSRIRDSRVSGLGELRSAWEVGAWAGIQRTGVVTSPYDNVSASVSYQADVHDAHRSYVVSPSVSYSTPLSRKDYVSLSAGSDWVGRGFGDYYYDISAAGAAASGLDAYDGADRAGWKDWNASLLVAHAITGDLTHGLGLFATGGYQRLLGRYARSPIVADAGSPDQWNGAVGIEWTF